LVGLDNGGSLVSFDALLKATEKDEAERVKNTRPKEHGGSGDHKM